MKAILIRQPWAWLIVQGYKDVETRTWSTKYRGPILIHAAKTLNPAFDELCQVLREEFDIEVPPRKQLPRGGIVGQATIVDCVIEYDSDFFSGPMALCWRMRSRIRSRPARGGSEFSICERSALIDRIVA